MVHLMVFHPANFGKTDTRQKNSSRRLECIAAAMLDCLRDTSPYKSNVWSSTPIWKLELNPVPFGQDQALALGILKAAQFGQLEN